MLRIPDIWRSLALTGCSLGLCADAANAEVAYLAYTEGYWQVWVLEGEPAQPRQVTSSGYEKSRCSWFPDGRHLFVAATDGRVFRVAVETGEEIELSLPLSGSTDAVVSPDGTRIAFSRTTPGTADDNDIWISRLDGTGLERLLKMPWLQHEPQWDPTGRWVFFLSGNGGQAHDIWRVAVDTGAREQLTAGALYHFDPAVAPDGRLAFSSNRTGDYEVYTQRLGEPPRRWTQSPGLDGGPTWSPDGRSLIFHSTRSGQLNLWQMAEGAAPVQLTFHETGARSPAWRPRGQQP